MVLISIIIGLGIAHILLGIGEIVDRLTGRGDRLRLSVAHGAWLMHTFFWLVLFWWWQFRLDVIWEEWTIGVYFFLVMYAVVLFLIAVILVPRDLGRRDGSQRLLPSAPGLILFAVDRG
jgi:hypothetical protein